MSTISLDEEARLYNTNSEREWYETQATLFGIIVALDYLERAYIRDSVTAAEYVGYVCHLLLHFISDVPIDGRYSPACTRLLSQYKTMIKLVGDNNFSIEDFMLRYRVRSEPMPSLYIPTIQRDRWIILLRYKGSKWVCQPLWNTRVRQAQRLANGLRRPLR